MKIEDLRNHLSKLTPDEYFNIDTGRKNNLATIKRKKIRFIDKEYRVVSNDENLFKEVIMELRSRKVVKTERSLNLMEYLIEKFKKLVITDEKEDGATKGATEGAIEVNSSYLHVESTKSTNSNSRIRSNSIEEFEIIIETKETQGIPDNLRYAVWQKYLGNILEGKCFVCDN